MNLLRIRTTNLFPWCIVLFLFNSCITENKIIGGEINPVTLKAGVFYADTFRVEAATMLTDSFISSRMSYQPVGIYKDPFAGKVYAEAYTQVRLDSNSELLSSALSSSAIHIGTVMTLTLDSSYIWGDSTPQTFHVYTLGQSIGAFQSPNTLYSYQQLPSGSNPIGSFKVYPHTYGDTINGGGTVNVALDNTLFNVLAQNAATLQNTTSYLQTAFYSVFNGLVIKPDPANTSMLRFNLAATNSITLAPQNYIQVYLQNGSVGDTITLQISTADNNGFYLKSDRTGSLLSRLENQYDYVTTKLTANTGFIQDGSGLRAKFSFPTIGSLNNIPGVVVNNAQLIISPIDVSIFQQPSDYFWVAYSDSLNHKKRTSTDSVVYLQDDRNGGGITSNTNPAVVYYDSLNNQYTVPLTNYVQDVLEGKINNNGIIAGSITSSGFISGAIVKYQYNYSANLTRFGDYYSGSKGLRLRVYYTINK